jgi:hypothetical protein
MKLHVPSTNLIYIEQLLKEGFKKSDEKSTMVPIKSIRANANKRDKKIHYVVLIKS